MILMTGQQIILQTDYFKLFSFNKTEGRPAELLVDKSLQMIFGLISSFEGFFIMLC